MDKDFIIYSRLPLTGGFHPALDLKPGFEDVWAPTIDAPYFAPAGLTSRYEGHGEVHAMQDVIVIDGRLV